MKKLTMILLMTLMLTACGAWPAGEETQAHTEAEPFALADGRAVEEEEFLFWLQTVCTEIAAACEAAGEPLDWNAHTDGQPLADYAKEQALSCAALYAAVEARAEQCGCAVTEAEFAQVWQEKAAAHGGETAYLSSLAERGLDRKTAQKLERIHRLYLQLCRLAQTRDSALWAAEEALQAYFDREDYVTAEILFFSGEDAPQKAAEVFAKLNGSADAAGEFSRIYAQQEEGMFPRTFQTADTGVPPAFSAAAVGLEPGQISGIINCGDDCGIVLRLEDDVSALRQEFLDDELQEAARQAKIMVGNGYRAVDVQRLWDGWARSR